MMHVLKVNIVRCALDLVLQFSWTVLFCEHTGKFSYVALTWVDHCGHKVTLQVFLKGTVLILSAWASVVRSTLQIFLFLPELILYFYFASKIHKELRLLGDRKGWDIEMFLHHS